MTTAVRPSTTSTQSFRHDNEALKVEARRHGVRVNVLIGAMQIAWEAMTHEQQRDAIWNKQQWVFAETKRLTEEACRNPTKSTCGRAGCSCSDPS